MESALLESRLSRIELKSIGGTANILLGCAMQWFSDAPSSGAHVTALVGMAFVAYGLLQKMLAVTMYFDLRATRTARRGEA